MNVARKAAFRGLILPLSFQILAPREASINKGEKLLALLENVLLKSIADMEKSGWKYGKLGSSG